MHCVAPYTDNNNAHTRTADVGAPSYFPPPTPSLLALPCCAALADSLYSRLPPPPLFSSLCGCSKSRFAFAFALVAVVVAAAASSFALSSRLRVSCVFSTCCCCFLVFYFLVEEFQFQEIFKNIPWQ